MSRYQFIVGATLTALERDLNRIADDDPDLELRQVLLAQGTGFVAVVEHGRRVEPEPDPVEQREEPRKPRKSAASKA